MTARSESHNIARSEEHTSELQSHSDLVCRLLLEKKKKNRQRSEPESDIHERGLSRDSPLAVHAAAHALTGRRGSMKLERCKCRELVQYENVSYTSVLIVEVNRIHHYDPLHHAGHPIDYTDTNTFTPSLRNVLHYAFRRFLSLRSLVIRVFLFFF